MKSQRFLAMLVTATLAALVVVFSSAGVAWAATWTAASCSYTDVSNAINEASSGDTVIVPSGSATWSSSLSITKGLIVKGAGIGQTVITGNITNQYVGVVTYSPANPSLNEPFRLTGFTINANSMSNGVYIANTSTTVAISQIRVDHNKIEYAGGSNANRGIRRMGMIYGVFDNNAFIEGQANSEGAATGGPDWALESLTFGTANNIFYEDNTFTNTTLRPFVDGEQGGRRVMRYNTCTNTTVSEYPCCDAHGNQPGALYAMMVLETYGNVFNLGSGTGDMLDQRGGNALCFFNQVNSGSAPYMQVRDEYNDNLTGEGYVQKPNNSYYWNNRYNGTLFGTSVPIEETGTATGGGSNYLSVASASSSLEDGRYGIMITSGTGSGQCANITGGTSTQYNVSPNWTTIPDSTSHYSINADWQYNGLVENVNFFNDQTPNFNGTVGCGCGPLSSRPSTCSVGVGYWATNQTCTQVSSANCGPHPSAPLSGTFYKCTATNTWTSYYTPYTYPHPLRVSGPVADSPPTAPPAVYDGTTTGVETLTTTLTTQLSANWSASSDPVNGISGYQYAIGTSAGSTNVVGWTSLGNVLAVTQTGLSLNAGTTYYFSVKAVDGEGIIGSATNSSGCKVVADIPTAPPAVYDGTTTGVETLTTTLTTQLSANWTAASDPQSGITGYKYAIGTTAGGTNVVGWTSLGNVLAVTKTGLSLNVGTTYYFSVEAVNGVGATGPATNSSGCTVVSSGSTVYFQDNFESWSVYGGAWSSVLGVNSSHTLNTDTAYAAAGTHSLQLFGVDTAGPIDASLSKTLSPTVTTDIYTRFYVFLPTGYTAANSAVTRRLLRVWCGSNRGQISLEGGNPLMEQIGNWGAAEWPSAAVGKYVALHRDAHRPALDEHALGALGGWC